MFEHDRAAVCTHMWALGISADFSHYRGLKFGMNVSDAATEAGTAGAGAKLVHQRPALIQEMEWQPHQSFPPGPASRPTAEVEAVRLDAQEAPQREIEKPKDKADAERLVLEKARSENRPSFRP